MKYKKVYVGRTKQVKINMILFTKKSFICKCYLFIPISLIADGGGPINITPSLAHFSQNSTFSERNPYPGCMAWLFDFLAISNILFALR